jgi:DNA-binding NarL/FixJ family response regulator
MTRPTDFRVTQLRVGDEELLVIGLPLSSRDDAEAARLTKVELQVAKLAAAGLSNAEIAAVRRRSERTVANQMASILRKAGVSSRHQLGRLVAAAGAGE